MEPSIDTKKYDKILKKIYNHNKKSIKKYVENNEHKNFPAIYKKNKFIESDTNIKKLTNTDNKISSEDLVPNTKYIIKDTNNIVVGTFIEKIYNKGIDGTVETFNYFKKCHYIKYFPINMKDLMNVMFSKEMKKTQKYKENIEKINKISNFTFSDCNVEKNGCYRMFVESKPQYYTYYKYTDMPQKTRKNVKKI